MLDIVKIRFKIPFYSRITAKNDLARYLQNKGVIIKNKKVNIDYAKR